MPSRPFAWALSFAAAGLLAGCATPFDQQKGAAALRSRVATEHATRVPASRYRPAGDFSDATSPQLPPDASPDDFVRYALYHSPRVEAAYQRWRAASERLPQVSALPDPRLSFGFFLNEVETRVGAQQARVGISQSFPWPGKLHDRRDAASRAALAAWHRFEGERLAVTELVVSALHELAYLDSAIRTTDESLSLLRSIEQVVRVRYRVGAGSHPELIRTQIELAQLEDRLAQLGAMRPAFVAELNAALNREPSAQVATLPELPGRVADIDAERLDAIARRANPALLALDQQIEQRRILTGLARKDGLPDLTVGLSTIITDEAPNPAIAESGDDPVLLTFGFNLPIWREKYDAGVREALARRLAASRLREDEANKVSAALHRALFGHTDADRRVRLYEHTLIPKAEQSLRASLASYRAGDASFTDLLETQQTLLEFAIAAERARADRGKSLARLNTLAGEQVPSKPADQLGSTETQP